MMKTNPIDDVAAMEVGADIDWVAKGMVTRVKNQGQCGSCWAFSAVATVESFYKLKNQTVDLSEQQLVDCSASYGNHGCDGGSHVEGTKYIRDKGVTTESDYPYVGKTETCKKQGGAHKVTSVLQTKGCTGMQNALMSRPLGVGVDARGWGKYSSGVFSDCGTDLNHALLLVGVASTYWHIKNSWGTSWGEHGFIRLALGNTCGICQS